MIQRPHCEYPISFVSREGNTNIHMWTCVLPNMQIYRITKGVREEVGYKDTPHLRRMAMQEGCYYSYEYNNSRRFGETGACCRPHGMEGQILGTFRL